MFETDLDESISNGYVRRFTERFFPVTIIKREDYLIIDDNRIDGRVALPLFFAVIILPLLIMFGAIALFNSWGILLAIFFAVAVGVLFFMALSHSYHRRVAFYKDKDLFEITEKTLFKESKKTGYISDIKRLEIEVNWVKSDDNNESFSSRSFIALEYGGREVLERNTFGNDYKTTTKIVFAICDYVNVPYAEEEIRNYLSD